MARRKPRTFPPEFRRMAVERALSGEQSIAELERELELSDGLLRQWVKKYRAAKLQGKTLEDIAAEQKEIARLKRENQRLREENAILYNFGGSIEDMSLTERFAWIDQHRDQWNLRRLCAVLEVSESGYYAWRTREPSARERQDHQLMDIMREIQIANNGRYGSRRMREALNQRGITCALRRVQRLMRLADLQPPR